MSLYCKGDRVEVCGYPWKGVAEWEEGVVAHEQPRHMPQGYMRVVFNADGLSLLVHESRVRAALPFCDSVEDL